ncbi:pentapeptide repeat-containing protein [Listeria aquatica]|uniref:Pentapeptide repeat-containing protein n=1 Tax=Listeria aquatica TaxID=1494960 RepID=A0A841ZP09_9LIST|nr:pentapeptide repeat-containing protein [Listeria aquatica]MBC1521098.1 pentapeptide repeat-containing protein [Listeria aquatica]
MKITAPKIPELLTEQSLLTYDDPFFSQIAFSGAFPLAEEEHYMIDHSRFQNTYFENRFYPRIELSDVSFEKSDLSNLALYSSSVHRVTFSDCKLTGIDFSETMFQNVTFQNCRLNLAGFNFSRFKSVAFTDCDLSGAEFDSTEFKQFMFTRCNLEECLFANTSLLGLDFTDSTFNKITATVPALKGLKVNREQALSLSTILGIIIEE